MWQINTLFVLNTKCYVWGKFNTSLSTILHIFKQGGGCIMLWVCLSLSWTRYGGIKINGIELSTGKLLEENLVQTAFYQTLGDKSPFQEDINIKCKAKSTLELLTKTTLNVPELPSYSFDLNQLENVWKDLKTAV